MSKDLFIAAHEELISEYLESHPDATWREAYESTADLIQNRYTDKAADLIDDARERNNASANTAKDF